MSRKRDLLRVCPIQSEEEQLQVLEASKEDQDDASLATHYVLKGGAPVGAFCIDSPTVYWWMHTSKTNILDSMQVMAALEALARERGHTNLIFPVAESSPYNKIMQQWGYTESSELWKLYTKQL